jgi:methyl-accepting chemotaxis protein
MNAKELLLRKLSTNYSNLLESFDSTIKKYKEFSKKHPIVLVTTKQKPDEDFSKSFIFEEVSEGNEDEFEGLEDLDDDIQDLLEIFKHTNHSIKNQGETLELIQDKIEESSVNIESATQNLKTASSYAGTFGLTLLGGLLSLF